MVFSLLLSNSDKGLRTKVTDAVIGKAFVKIFDKIYLTYTFAWLDRANQWFSKASRFLLNRFLHNTWQKTFVGFLF